MSAGAVGVSVVPACPKRRFKTEVIAPCAPASAPPATAVAVAAAGVGPVGEALGPAVAGWALGSALARAPGAPGCPSSGTSEYRLRVSYCKKDPPAGQMGSPNRTRPIRLEPRRQAVRVKRVPARNLHDLVADLEVIHADGAVLVLALGLH